MSTPLINGLDQKLTPILEENEDDAPMIQVEAKPLDDKPNLDPSLKTVNAAIKAFRVENDELRKAEIPYYLSGDALRVPKNPQDRTFMN
ncbi:MAG: hypothetical protein KFB93_06055 [Simkaniaceae bacterium]|nr:MAG: hypothetical protein KFB93_06055 [Simkaniaceae bacterium]